MYIVSRFLSGLITGLGSGDSCYLRLYQIDLGVGLILRRSERWLSRPWFLRAIPCQVSLFVTIPASEFPGCSWEISISGVLSFHFSWPGGVYCISWHCCSYRAIFPNMPPSLTIITLDTFRSRVCVYSAWNAPLLSLLWHAGPDAFQFVYLSLH